MGAPACLMSGLTAELAVVAVHAFGKTRAPIFDIDMLNLDGFLCISGVAGIGLPSKSSCSGIPASLKMVGTMSVWVVGTEWFSLLNTRSSNEKWNMDVFFNFAGLSKWSILANVKSIISSVDEIRIC